jgi:hypothetical protein
METGQFLQLCKEETLFLRPVNNMGNSLGKNAIRIAVKDEKTSTKMHEITKGVMDKVQKNEGSAVLA